MTTYSVLAGRIRAALSDLERVVRRAEDLLSKAQQLNDDDYLADAPGRSAAWGRRWRGLAGCRAAAVVVRPAAGWGTAATSLLSDALSSAPSAHVQTGYRVLVRTMLDRFGHSPKRSVLFGSRRCGEAHPERVSRPKGVLDSY